MKLLSSLAKLFKHLFLAILAAILVLLTIAWFTRPAGNQEQPKFVIGDLGGMKVNIPSYYVELLEYEGDPGWSGKRKGPKPARTHQSRMTSFGVMARYPDMAGLSSPAMWADKDKYTVADTPWIDLTVLSGPIYPGDGWLDRGAQHVIDGVRTSSSDDFKKEGDKQFGGLDLYVLQGESINGTPAREDSVTGNDIYIQQDERGHVKTYISCSNAKYPAVLCEHAFSMEDDGLRIQVSIQYRRTMLAHWQDIQEKARRLILSWKAPEMPSPATPPTSSVRH